MGALSAIRHNQGFSAKKKTLFFFHLADLFWAQHHALEIKTFRFSKMIVTGSQAQVQRWKRNNTQFFFVAFLFNGVNSFQDPSISLCFSVFFSISFCNMEVIGIKHVSLQLFHIRTSYHYSKSFFEQ